jgi:TetR/AcrR family transcriptional regulator
VPVPRERGRERPSQKAASAGDEDPHAFMIAIDAFDNWPGPGIDSTNQLVKNMTATRTARTRPRDSRTAVLRAAEREFAAHGFAGTGVDAIARRAGVNKAMIYYHFDSKLGLYREMLREGFRALLAEARSILAEPRAPINQLEAYVSTLLRAGERRPHLIPIMLREVAAGGRQLDPETLRLLTGLFQVVRQIVEDGRRRGDFRDLDPLLTHLVIMGAAILYMANEPIRTRIDRLKLIDGPVRVPFGSEPFVRYVSAILRGGLCRKTEGLDDV